MFNDASPSATFANVRSDASRRAEGRWHSRLTGGRTADLALHGPWSAAARPLPRLGSWDRAWGRSIDVSIASIVLLAMLPALTVIALLIWLGDGGSPFFAQRRIGRGGILFPCLKFRTMVRDSSERLQALLESDEAAALEWARDQKLRNDPRITPLGGFLRKTSLDEIPQLANVLLGHMSMVGPRPIVEEEIVRYRHHFARYCSVRPGITGLWQVSGRNAVSYRRRVALDVAYCRAKSVPLDLIILARTVPAVVSGRGCS